MYQAFKCSSRSIECAHSAGTGRHGRHLITDALWELWCGELALSTEHNGQQSHAHVHSVLSLAEVGGSLIGVKVRAVTHNQYTK